MCVCFGIFEGMGPAANYSIIYGTFASRHTHHTTQVHNAGATACLPAFLPARQTDRWRADRRTKKTDNQRTDNHAPTFVHRACIMNTPCVYVPPHSTPDIQNRKPQKPHTLYNILPHTHFHLKTPRNQAVPSNSISCRVANAGSPKCLASKFNVFGSTNSFGLPFLRPLAPSHKPQKGTARNK